MAKASIKLLATKFIAVGHVWQAEVEASQTLWMSPLMSGMRHWNFLTVGLRTPPGPVGPKMLVLIVLGLAVRLGWQKYEPVRAA